MSVCVRVRACARAREILKTLKYSTFGVRIGNKKDLIHEGGGDDG
jgi:hypothetical protein